MGYGDLATIGIAGFQASLTLSIHNRYLMPLLLQKPGRCNANNTCAQYDYVHACLPKSTECGEASAAGFFNRPPLLLQQRHQKVPLVTLNLHHAVFYCTTCATFGL